jgi:hypothetical protein
MIFPENRCPFFRIMLDDKIDLSGRSGLARSV